MQIYKTNRTTEGLPPGTFVVRQHDLPLDYKGALTVEAINFGEGVELFYKVTIARSQLDFVRQMSDRQAIFELLTLMME